ncbi:MAG: hypothetical protein ACLFQV_08175 [Vulcanimicrobiota bacterium]
MRINPAKLQSTTGVRSFRPARATVKKPTLPGDSFESTIVQNNNSNLNLSSFNSHVPPSHSEEKALVSINSQSCLSQLQQDPTAWKQYQALPAKEKQEFLKLARATLRPVKMGSTGSFHSELALKNIFGRVSPALTSILKSGKLQNKDSMGKTLLANLNRIFSQKFTNEVDSRRIKNQVLSIVANPDLISQGNKGTCTMTTLEYINAVNHPAEFVRIISGLTSPDKQVQLRNGETLIANRGSLKPDNSSRLDVNRIYQASMMEYGNGELDYDNAGDINVRRTMLPSGAIKEETLHKGLYPPESNRSFDAVLPYKSSFAEFSPIDREKVDGQFQKLTDKGAIVPIALAWRGPKENIYEHKVAVEGMDDQYAYIRDPFGSNDMGKTPQSPSDEIERELAFPEKPYSGGHIKVKKDEFYNRLLDYHFPAK